MMSVLTKSCPYVDVGRNGFTYLFVVGRDGTIVWRGNHTVKDKEFLKAVGRALAVNEAPPIGKVLSPALDSAVARYAESRFFQSRTAAQKVLDKHASKSSESSAKIARDAAFLIERIDAYSAELLEEMAAARESGSALAFVEAARRLTIGFSKSISARKVRELEKQALADRQFAARIKVAREWLELAEKRPVLFPARADRASKTFAKKLGKFVKQNKGSAPAQEAQKLLERFASS